MQLHFDQVGESLELPFVLGRLVAVRPQTGQGGYVAQDLEKLARYAVAEPKLAVQDVLHVVAVVVGVGIVFRPVDVRRGTCAQGGNMVEVAEQLDRERQHAGHFLQAAAEPDDLGTLFEGAAPEKRVAFENLPDRHETKAEKHILRVVVEVAVAAGQAALRHSPVLDGVPHDLELGLGRAVGPVRAGNGYHGVPDTGVEETERNDGAQKASGGFVHKQEHRHVGDEVAQELALFGRDADRAQHARLQEREFLLLVGVGLGRRLGGLVGVLEQRVEKHLLGGAEERRRREGEVG